MKITGQYVLLYESICFVKAFFSNISCGTFVIRGADSTTRKTVTEAIAWERSLLPVCVQKSHSLLMTDQSAEPPLTKREGIHQQINGEDAT